MIANTIYKANEVICDIKPNSVTSRLILMVPVISQIFLTSKVNRYWSEIKSASQERKMEILREWKSLNDTAGRWSRMQYVTLFVSAIVFIPGTVGGYLFVGAFIMNETILKWSDLNCKHFVLEYAPPKDQADLL